MRKVIRAEEKLRAMIDEANSLMDCTDSAKLARYLAERGVTVAPLPIEIGTPVYVIKAIDDKSPGGKYNSIVCTMHYLRHGIRNRAEFYIAEKAATKSDGAKLGKLVFITKEEAEAKLKEYIAEFEEG